MKKLAILLVLAGLVTLLAQVGTASAFEGGGRMPSQAPLAEPGVHYSGQLNNHESDANFAGNEEVAFWRLPPVSTRDTVTVNWHALPFTHDSGDYPICLILVQGVDDFSWGSVFEHRAYCNTDGPTYGLSGSGTAQTAIPVQNTDSTSTYLEFFSYASSSSSNTDETYPYDFSIEAPRHYLGLSLSPVTEVAANGAVEGTVLNALGLPAPDGLVFGLTVTWGKGGVASYTAATANGHLAFPLALPESSFGERASIAVGRVADGQFQEAAARTSLTIKAPYVPPAPPRPSRRPTACEKVTAELLPLSRHLHRLRNHAKRVKGPAKRKLIHRAHGVGQKVGKLKHRKRAVCR